MKKKNGFTLIELLVVISLISVLLILFLPSILNTGNNVKTKLYDNKITLIEKAANNFIEANKNIVKSNSNMCLTINYLVQKGYLVSDGNDGSYIINPITNTKLAGRVLIQYSNRETGIWKATSKYTETENCITLIDSGDNTSSRYEILDPESPSGNSIVINDGASLTTSSSVKLSLNNNSNTATQMCLSNIPVCSDFQWQPYDTLVQNWLLDTSITGSTKTVYAWFKDSNNLVSTYVLDTIELIDGAPKITFEPSSNNQAEKSVSVKYRVTSYSNIAEIKYAWLNNKTTTYLTTSSYIPSNTNDYSETLNKSGTGTYYLCVSAKTKTNYVNTVCSDAYMLDNTAPIITFSVNGNTSPKSSQSTVVSISDLSSITTRKYLWTTANNTSAIYGTNMTSNSQTITKSDGDGKFYLCIYAVDIAGNITNTCSNYFVISNSTINGSIVLSGNTYGTDVYKNTVNIKGSCSFGTNTGTANVKIRTISKTGTIGNNSSTNFDYSVLGSSQLITLTCKDINNNVKTYTKYVGIVNYSANSSCGAATCNGCYTESCNSGYGNQDLCNAWTGEGLASDARCYKKNYNGDTRWHIISSSWGYGWTLETIYCSRNTSKCGTSNPYRCYSKYNLCNSFDNECTKSYYQCTDASVCGYNSCWHY